RARAGAAWSRARRFTVDYSPLRESLWATSRAWAWSTWSATSCSLRRASPARRAAAISRWSVTEACMPRPWERLVRRDRCSFWTTVAVGLRERGVPGGRHHRPMEARVLVVARAPALRRGGILHPTDGRVQRVGQPQAFGRRELRRAASGEAVEQGPQLVQAA